MLITSCGLFTMVIAADHSSRGYEASENPADVALARRTEQQHEAEVENQTAFERAMAFGRKERYKIVGASWLASMVGAFTIVNRDKYLTGPQKLVQARVYAQGLTLAVLIASAGFELSDRNKERGRWEEVEYVDEKDHKKHRKMVEKGGGSKSGGDEEEKSPLDSSWKDMVKQEEERLAEREKEIKATEERDRKKREQSRKEDPKKAKKEVKKTVEKGRKEEEKRRQEATGGDDEVELVEPVKGKKGEGKMMKKVSDAPDPNKGFGVR